VASSSTLPIFCIRISPPSSPLMPRSTSGIHAQGQRLPLVAFTMFPPRPASASISDFSLLQSKVPFPLLISAPLLELRHPPFDKRVWSEVCWQMTMSGISVLLRQELWPLAISCAFCLSPFFRNVVQPAPPISGRSTKSTSVMISSMHSNTATIVPMPPRRIPLIMAYTSLTNFCLLPANLLRIGQTCHTL
ncbi:hypothetical protein H0H81_007943, partial [Sphagnurus paluster]